MNECVWVDACVGEREVARAWATQGECVEWNDCAVWNGVEWYKKSEEVAWNGTERECRNNKVDAVDIS